MIELYSKTLLIETTTDDDYTYSFDLPYDARPLFVKLRAQMAYVPDLPEYWVQSGHVWFDEISLFRYGITYRKIPARTDFRYHDLVIEDGAALTANINDGLEVYLHGVAEQVCRWDITARFFAL